MWFVVFLHFASKIIKKNKKNYKSHVKRFFLFFFGFRSLGGGGLFVQNGGWGAGGILVKSLFLVLEGNFKLIFCFWIILFGIVREIAPPPLQGIPPTIITKNFEFPAKKWTKILRAICNFSAAIKNKKKIYVGFVVYLLYFISSWKTFSKCQKTTNLTLYCFCLLLGFIVTTKLQIRR